VSPLLDDLRAALGQFGSQHDALRFLTRRRPRSVKRKVSFISGRITIAVMMLSRDHAIGEISILSAFLNLNLSDYCLMIMCPLKLRNSM